DRAPDDLARRQRIAEVELRHSLRRHRHARQAQRGEGKGRDPARDAAGTRHRDQTNRMMKAMTSAYRATASVSAKPRMARPNTLSRAAGLRATLFTRAAKMFPMPTPTPASAITAIPAPSCLAEIKSIGEFLSLRASGPGGTRPGRKRWRRGLVEVDRVVQVDAGEDGEDVGLQHRDEELEADQQHIDAERHGGGQIAEQPRGAE